MFKIRKPIIAIFAGATTMLPSVSLLSCTTNTSYLGKLKYKSYVGNTTTLDLDVNTSEVFNKYIKHDNTLKNVDNYLIKSNTKVTSDVAIIYLDGGPSFTKAEQKDSFWPLGVSNFTSGTSGNKCKFFTHDFDDFEVYSFIESQVFLMREYQMTNYSYDFANDVNKVTLTLLDIAINHLKDKGKKVYVMGHSFGAFLLYSYLSTFETTNADGIVIGAGRMEYESDDRMFLIREESRLAHLTNISDYFGMLDGYYKLSFDPTNNNYFTNKLITSIDWEGIDDTQDSYPDNIAEFGVGDIMLNDFIYKFDEVLPVIEESVRFIKDNFRYFNQIGVDYINSKSGLVNDAAQIMIGESIDFVYNAMVLGEAFASGQIMRQLLNLSNLLKLQYSTMRLSSIERFIDRDFSRKVVAVAAMEDEATDTISEREMEAHRATNIPLITMDMGSHNLWYFDFGLSGTYFDASKYFSGMGIALSTLIDKQYDYDKIFGTDLRLEFNVLGKYDGSGSMLGTGELPFLNQIGKSYDYFMKIYGYGSAELAEYANAFEV